MPKDNDALISPDDLLDDLYGATIPPEPDYPEDLPIPGAEEKGGARARFVVRDATFALLPQPPVDWVIENLFSAGSVSLIVGNPGTKKTRTLIDAAVVAAMGGKWLHFQTKQSTVLYVDEESGERRFARWLGDALRGEEGDGATPIKFVSLARLNLFRNDGDSQVLEALILETGAQLVIIDSLADIMPGGDENAVKDVHPVFMRLRKIAEETGAAIVVIHHSNKAGGYRGSSAMSGAVDLLIMVDSKNSSPILTFETIKARDTEPIKFSAEIHFEDGRTWLSTIDKSQSVLSVKRKISEEYVIHILAERGAMPLPEIESRADTCGSRTARDAVFKLAKEGVIYRTNPGETGRGHPAIYDIKKEPENEEK